MTDKKQTVYAEIDLKKIFLTPPNTKKEKITLVVVMVLVFMIFFGPLTFTEVAPLHAVLISAVPTLTVSWGWIVLLRSIGRKAEFAKGKKTR